MNIGKFNLFTDDELYVLKRQAIEGSFNIMMLGGYDKEFKKAHGEMLNGIMGEIVKRKRGDKE